MRSYDDVLAFWFPEGLAADLEAHKKHMEWCMRGGADGDIVERFSDLTREAANDQHDDWAESAEGRLALIVVLDQFSRSVFRGTPEAYAQDPKALALALGGLENGHYASLDAVWKKFFFTLPLVHAEGPDLRERVARAVSLAERLVSEAPAAVQPIYAFSLEQARYGLSVVEQFGRHPHRNEVLGRSSTPEELVFIERGDFTHTRPLKLS